MFSICSREAGESPVRHEEDLLTGSPSWAFPKFQMDGEQLGPLVLGNHHWVCSGAISQLPAARMDGFRWTPTAHGVFWAGLVTWTIRTLVTWQGLQPPAGSCGVQHGHGLAKQQHKQRLPGPQPWSFPPPWSGKTVCHLLITWISTTRLYLIQTQHLTTANLQDESSLYLLLPFM